MTRETRNTTLNIVEEKKNEYNNTPGKSEDFFFKTYSHITKFMDRREGCEI